MSRRVGPDLLTGDEVALLFGVNRELPGKWSRQGKLHATRTPGGHLRFFAAEVQALLNGEPAFTDEQIKALTDGAR